MEPLIQTREQLDDGSQAFLGTQPTTKRTQVDEKFNAKRLRLLGCSQVIIGILCVVLQGVWLILISGFVQFPKDDYPYYYEEPALPSTGIWCGVLFIVSGVFAIQSAKRKTRPFIVTSLVLSICSAVFAIAPIVCSSFGLAIDCSRSYTYIHVPVERPSWDDNDHYRDYGNHRSQTEEIRVNLWDGLKVSRITVMSLLLCASLAEAFVGCFSAFVCGKVVTCCGQAGTQPCCVCIFTGTGPSPLDALQGQGQLVGACNGKHQGGVWVQQRETGGFVYAPVYIHGSVGELHLSGTPSTIEPADVSPPVPEKVPSPPLKLHEAPPTYTDLLGETERV